MTNDHGDDEDKRLPMTMVMMRMRMVMMMMMKVMMKVMMMMMMTMVLMIMMKMMLTTARTRLDFIKCAHVCLILNRACFFALLKRAPILVKFKKKFPPNDKAEPQPMLSLNSYAYVPALYFASDSTCLCLGV